MECVKKTDDDFADIYCLNKDKVVIGPGQNPTGKLVWVTPKNYSKRALVFKPTFASKGDFL